MLLMFEDEPPITQNELLHSIDEDEEDIEHDEI
jgi:hypothetical protein